MRDLRVAGASVAELPVNPRGIAAMRRMMTHWRTAIVGASLLVLAFLANSFQAIFVASQQQEVDGRIAEQEAVLGKADRALDVYANLLLLANIDKNVSGEAASRLLPSAGGEAAADYRKKLALSAISDLGMILARLGAVTEGGLPSALWTKYYQAESAAKQGDMAAYSRAFDLLNPAIGIIRKRKSAINGELSVLRAQRSSYQRNGRWLQWASIAFQIVGLILLLGKEFPKAGKG